MNDWMNSENQTSWMSWKSIFTSIRSDGIQRSVLACYPGFCNTHVCRQLNLTFPQPIDYLGAQKLEAESLILKAGLIGLLQLSDYWNTGTNEHSFSLPDIRRRRVTFRKTEARWELRVQPTLCLRVVSSLIGEIQSAPRSRWSGQHQELHVRILPR